MAEKEEEDASSNINAHLLVGIYYGNSLASLHIILISCARSIVELNFSFRSTGHMVREVPTWRLFVVPPVPITREKQK